MKKQSSGETKPENNSAQISGSLKESPKNLTLLDLRDLWFTSPITGKPTNVEDASSAEFFQFISWYVQAEGEDLDTWSLEDRRDVLNFSVEQGQSPNFLPNSSPNFLSVSSLSTSEVRENETDTTQTKTAL
jgi:hypothetical protein